MEIKDDHLYRVSDGCNNTRWEPIVICGAVLKNGWLRSMDVCCVTDDLGPIDSLLSGQQGELSEGDPDKAPPVCFSFDDEKMPWATTYKDVLIRVRGADDVVLTQSSAQRLLDELKLALDRAIDNGKNKGESSRDEPIRCDFPAAYTEINVLASLNSIVGRLGKLEAAVFKPRDANGN